VVVFRAPLATTLELVSPLTLSLEGKEEILATTLEVILLIPDAPSLGREEGILATTLHVTSLGDTLDLKEIKNKQCPDMVCHQLKTLTQNLNVEIYPVTTAETPEIVAPGETPGLVATAGTPAETPELVATAETPAETPETVATRQHPEGPLRPSEPSGLPTSLKGSGSHAPAFPTTTCSLNPTNPPTNTG
jgi:hypothetical protein